MPFPEAGMFRQKLKIFLKKLRSSITPSSMRRSYACDGSHCLSVQSLPNHLEEYGFTFYNEVAAYGDCCRGPIVFISQAERQRIAEHLAGILPHMSQEGQFIVKEYLRQKGPEQT